MMTVQDTIRTGNHADVNARLHIPGRFYGKGNDMLIKKYKLARKNDKGLYIHGKCGRGKTHAAIGLLM